MASGASLFAICRIHSPSDCARGGALSGGLADVRKLVASNRGKSRSFFVALGVLLPCIFSSASMSNGVVSDSRRQLVRETIWLLIENEGRPSRVGPFSGDLLEGVLLQWLTRLLAGAVAAEDNMEF